MAKKTGLVLQDIVLFLAVCSIMRIYNDEISEEQVLNAIDYVHAGDFCSLNNDLQFEIKERGLNLSMGKRLLSFARALSFNPGVMVWTREQHLLMQKLRHKYSSIWIGYYIINSGNNGSSPVINC